MAEQQLIGALEAGGTKMVCATGYADGTVLEREQIATTTPQETVEAVNAWFADKDIAALGIGAFGPTAVNPASSQYGKILETPKTAWRYFDLLGTIQNELNIPCGYDTDVNVACLGEVTFGCAQGLTDVVYLTIGTGVGGGVIVNGDVVSGVVGAGGEIGHMCLNPEEERTCGCGGHGHLEQYSSATGVVSNYLAECKKAGVEPIELTGPSDSKDVFQACREGDKLALAAADTMADYLGRALALIANVVDPEMFLIGGGASASADVYLDKVREHFKQYALSASRETPIKVASLGNDAGIIGAAYVALRAAGK